MSCLTCIQSLNCRVLTNRKGFKLSFSVLSHLNNKPPVPTTTQLPLVPWLADKPSFRGKRRNLLNGQICCLHHLGRRHFDAPGSIHNTRPILTSMSLSSGPGDSAEMNTFLSEILDRVKQHRLLVEEYDQNEKVVDFVHPADLGATIGLGISPDPASLSRLHEICDKVIKYSVKTCHPHFYNQLYHGVDEYGLAGSWLSDALNTNGHTFEVAPVFTVVEKQFIKYTMEKFGYLEGDGIFSPGGSISNMYGMVLARHKQFPDLKSEGLYATGGKPLAVFTSEESHYSIVKGANWLGLGVNNVYKVKTDDQGRMIPEMLEEAIQSAKDQGKIPFFVNLTSGTTVMGAYDDLDTITDICKKHGIWCHVDACWGGSVILSQELKGLMKGSNKTDSIAWNPHKMVGAPLQTSIFITKHPGLLHEANSASARYLFQQDKFYDVSYDTGDKSVQCGRKVDAFKVWFMFVARGEKYMAEVVENAFARARYLHEQVKVREGFKPAFAFDDVGCTNVCFRYIPQAFRGKEENEAWWDKLSKVPPMIKQAMILKGSLMIGYQPLPHKQQRNFFRMVLPGVPKPTDQDMDFILNEIERCGKNIPFDL